MCKTRASISWIIRLLSQQVTQFRRVQKVSVFDDLNVTFGLFSKVYETVFSVSFLESKGSEIIFQVQNRPFAEVRTALRGATTYRIVVGPQAGRKVFILQSPPACEPADYADTAGIVSV